jgi:hypothetical protein
MSLAIAALLFLATTSVSAVAQTLPIPSRWTPQNYSYLEFDDNVAREEFTGIFVDHEPNFACANVLSKLTGFVNGAQVRFTVEWWTSGP